MEPERAQFSDIPDSALDPSISRSTQHVRASAHLHFAEGQIQYLNQNWGQASLSFANAVEELPDFVPARIGRLNALYRAGNAAGPALDEVTELAEVLERVDRANAGVAQIYAAAFAAQREDTAAAADAIGALVGLERVEED